ncbi:type 4 pilus major pilin [Pseudomonas sp. FP833]|uniref:type 4 pilus major pilin n=1 Tax=Pseudomonas sp. FP833 TaxID=2954102 RepID=UPI002733A5F0|nr:type 4 pilus major pilin [Pseudomonas sp. FP833]WLI52193.1 type 4 pilus major pilin [Pseudomonas sp. FP833]
MALSTPHKQRGFLSVDGVMWIMLVTIALGFIAWMGYKMLGNSDAAIEQSNITSIIANTKKLKGSSGYGASGTNLVPSLIAIDGTGSMGVSGSTLTNQWNGAVTLVSAGMSFTITENNVPKAACINVAYPRSLRPNNPTQQSTLGRNRAVKFCPLLRRQAAPTIRTRFPGPLTKGGQSELDCRLLYFRELTSGTFHQTKRGLAGQPRKMPVPAEWASEILELKAQCLRQFETTRARVALSLWKAKCSCG